MALNVSYAAWAIVFKAIILGDTSVLNMWTIGCGLIVLICVFLAAADYKELFS